MFNGTPKQKLSGYNSAIICRIMIMICSTKYVQVSADSLDHQHSRQCYQHDLGYGSGAQAGPVEIEIVDGGHADVGRSHGRARDIVHGGGLVGFSNAS